jgi:NAD dependent epimerase/dehydratase family enzyme
MLRRGLCFVLGDPADRFSWISLEDALRMIEFAMRNESVHGALNVTAPVAATQGAFARAAAALAGRRVIGRLRSGLLRATLGELASAFVDVQDVAPAKALQEGFGHVHPTLQYWMSSRDKPEIRPMLEKAS